MNNLYFFLLILSYIFSHGIGVFRENKTDNSLDFHVRKRRIINKSRGPKRPSTLQEVPYMVRILRNGKDECGGSILSQGIIITAAHCVVDNERYSVISGSTNINHGEVHHVIRKIIYDKFNISRHADDLALLMIEPLINFRTSPNSEIKLYDEILPLHSKGIVSGWGCIHREGSRIEYPNELQSMTVSIINPRICASHLRHLPQLGLSDKDICTFDENKEKCCCKGDSGAPLVLRRKLLGIYSFSNNFDPKFPDVFVNLRHPPYRKWILEHVPRAIY